MHSATGVKRGFYHSFAGFLAKEGFTVITYDYRGIGGSRPFKLNKFQARMRDWGEKDMAGVIDWVEKEYPHAGILGVGHSVAGQVFGLAHNNRKVAAMLLVASQSGYWGHWPWHHKPAILLLWYFAIPVFSALVSYFPSRIFGMGENLPAGVAVEWASWGRDPDYITGDHNMPSQKNFSEYSGSILSYVIENDFFAPLAACEKLLTFYPTARTTLKVLSKDAGLKSPGHFDYFKKRSGAQLWPEAAAWLTQFAEQDT